MLITVNGVDLTPYIVESTYDVNAEKSYESWQDGNYVEHRIYTSSRVKGSFDVFLYGKDDMTTQAFLDNWNAAVDNEVITMGVFVQNENAMKTINAYFSFAGTFHREMVNGNYCDRITINITER